MRPGHLCHRCAPRELGNSGEDVLYAVGLSRQHVAGKNALARLAGHAQRQPDPHPAVPLGGLQAPLHPDVGQDDPGAGARRANTSGQNLVVSASQQLAVSGRVYFQYVCQHVPRRPRGFETAIGAVAFYYGRYQPPKFADISSVTTPPPLHRKRPNPLRPTPLPHGMGCDSQILWVTTIAERYYFRCVSFVVVLGASFSEVRCCRDANRQRRCDLSCLVVTRGKSCYRPRRI